MAARQDELEVPTVELLKLTARVVELERVMHTLLPHFSGFFARVDVVEALAEGIAKRLNDPGIAGAMSIYLEATKELHMPGGADPCEAMLDAIKKYEERMTMILPSGNVRN